MEIIKDLGLITIISGLIAYITRSFIGKYFDKKSKVFELDLSYKSDLFKLKLEKDSYNYKNELEIFFTKASRFHQKRLDTISNLFKNIVELRICLNELTSLYKDPNGNLDIERAVDLKKQEAAGRAYDIFKDFYN